VLAYYDRIGDAEAKPIAREMTATVSLKLSEARETIRLAREGRIDTAREVVMTNIGRDQMEFIRVRGEKLMALEGRRIAAGTRSIFDTLLFNRIGVASMTVASLLALVLLLRQREARERERTEQQRALQAERDRLEDEVRNRTADLTELARHLQTAREDERQRLARELHDELGALLTAAKLDAARIKPRLANLAPEATERLAHLTATLNSGIALKRRIIEDLRPSSLSNLGLVAALEILLREFATRSEIKVVDDLAPVSVSDAAQLTIYRLVQEALTNVVKYAKASEVSVTLQPSGDGGAVISVRDNGVGFDTSQPKLARHGLIGMRYRVEADGGTMRLESSPGRGTLIEATLPQAPAGGGQDDAVDAVPADAEA
jgi:signal transduction histidine kinase